MGCLLCPKKSPIHQGLTINDGEVVMCGIKSHVSLQWYSYIFQSLSVSGHKGLAMCHDTNTEPVFVLPDQDIHQISEAQGEDGHVDSVTSPVQLMTNNVIISTIGRKIKQRSVVPKTRAWMTSFNSRKGSTLNIAQHFEHDSITGLGMYKVCAQAVHCVAL